MKNLFASVLLTLFFCLTVWPQASRQRALEFVVAAENRFADSAAKNGTRAAFLEFAADAAVVFTDKPENAKENWQKRAPNTAVLSWRPAWADVSAAGDLGYTTGSWAFSRTKTDAPVAWGEYFTIWKKEADGTWRFVLDLGIGHDKAEVIANNCKSPEVIGKKKIHNESANIGNMLENSFAESYAKIGAKKTYEKFASYQIRLLREGDMPYQGKSNVLRLIPDAKLTTKILAIGVSSDLAYAYGEYELKMSDDKIEKGYYAQVWKQESKGWRIALEVFHPVLAQKN